MLLSLICTIIAAASALSFALLCRLVASGAAAGAAPAVPRVPGRAPWSLLARWPISSLALRLAPWLPVRLRTVVDRALERADLDESIRAEQWVMGSLLMGGCGMAVVGSGTHGDGFAVAVELPLAAACGAAIPWLALRDRILGRQKNVLRDLPGYLDLLALALEAGCAFGAALQLTVQRSAASALRTGMERVLHEVRAGSPRADALRRLDRRMGVGALGAAVAAIVQAEATGVSLAPVIRAQARRCTQQRFARAEKLAMEAPVKMLGPLILCIFPCTFIVIGFPIAVRLLWSQ